MAALLSAADGLVQRRLGYQSQRVGLLLLHGRRLQSAVDDGRSRRNALRRRETRYDEDGAGRLAAPPFSPTL